MTRALESAVAAHDAVGGLTERIFAELAATGADVDALTRADLAPVDEFHTAGRQATQRALGLTPLTSGMHVLDAGCGLGGAARALALDYGRRVAGLDPPPDFIDAARALTDTLGLADRCVFDQGGVRDMPYANDAFDAAVTLHVAMTIENRPRFYAELARVIRGNAPLCVFDVMKGPTTGMRYPVPWAETAASSFRHTRDQTVDLLSEAGSASIAEETFRAPAIAFFEAAFAKAAEAGGPPPLGLHLLLGPNGPEKFKMSFAALQAHQVEPVILIARRR